MRRLIASSLLLATLLAPAPAYADGRGDLPHGGKFPGAVCEGSFEDYTIVMPVEIATVGADSDARIWRQEVEALTANCDRFLREDIVRYFHYARGRDINPAEVRVERIRWLK